MSRPVKIPDAAHPIVIEPSTARIRVLVGAQVIADTTSALTLSEATYPPVQYVPLADVDASVLGHTPTSTYCPFKGDASYYSVTSAEGTVEDAGWTYLTPYDAVSPIATHVAFYPDRVRILVDGE